MINRLNKIIHNKYSKFFSFIFFLRYLFAIFIISTVLFLLIPNFFNYEKKAEIIKNHILMNYNFEIINYEEIKYQPFPRPRLELKNVIINLDSLPKKLKVEYLKIYPNIFSIYNYENYKSNKIVLKDSNIKIRAQNLRILIKNLISKKNKFSLDNLNLKVNDENKTILRLDNIKFSNYGYDKNSFQGNIFGKKFKIKTSDNFKKISFKLINSGINAIIDFDEIKKKKLNGVFKSKILNTSIKFKFNYDNKKLIISNSLFRSKNLSFRNNNEIVLEPFVELKSKFEIEEVNTKFIKKKINLKKLLASKDLIKKINSKNEFNFVSKKFSRNLINKMHLKADLAFGRMNFIKDIYIADNFFTCRGNVNLLEEYPLLFFNCSINSNDKQQFFKLFSIKSNSKNETLNLDFNGNLSVLNKKINFKKIALNKNYKALNEDLKYFKNKFEIILFNESFFEIFSLKKISEFIKEVS